MSDKRYCTKPATESLESYKSIQSGACNLLIQSRRHVYSLSRVEINPVCLRCLFVNQAYMLNDIDYLEPLSEVRFALL
jgi:hypothetical protein